MGLFGKRSADKNQERKELTFEINRLKREIRQKGITMRRLAKVNPDGVAEAKRAKESLTIELNQLLDKRRKL